MTATGADTFLAPARTAPERSQYTLPELTAPVLRQLVASEGYERTVDILHAAIRKTPPHAEFIRQVDALPADAALPQSLRHVQIALVPGALYREYPQTGADGKRFVDIVRRLGVTCETIPIRSFGSCAENGAILTTWLAQNPVPAGRKRVLVSFSKGSADIKTALLDPGNHAGFEGVHAWLSVGGLLHGTPLVAWLRDRPIRHLLAKLLMRLRRLDYNTFAEFAHGPGTPLHTPTLLPPHLRLLHLIALPTPADLSIPIARRAFRRLLPLGPNDAGGLLLADLPRFPGTIYPLPHTDHYLRNHPGLHSLLARLLLYGVRSMNHIFSS